jgi:RNA polymerase sigma-70 factor (ECF subfamily)
METSVGFLQRLLNEPDTAWQQMNDLYGRWLKGWLLRWDPTLGAEADDVLQDVMVIVLRDLSQFRRQGQGKFRAWLKTIAVNTLRQHQRARRRHLPAGGEGDVLAQLKDPASELSRQWDQEHDRHLVKRLLDLMETQFNATDMRAFRRLAEGAAAAEVAAELGVEVHIVYLAKSKILKQLREEAQGFLD